MFTRNYYLASVINALFPNPTGGIDETINRIKRIDGSFIPTISGYGKENGASSAIYSAGGIGYASNHMKKSKSDLVLDTSYKSSYDCPYGVCFGNGNAAESYDDYNMSGELFTEYTCSQSVEVAHDDDGVYYKILYTLTNTGTEDFTISEIGLFGSVYKSCKNYSGRYYRFNFLTERTLLESPITIPANGGVGQVTYTLRYNYPKV